MAKKIKSKLDYEVFDWPGCPKEATCAAVDKDGRAYWYTGDPGQVRASNIAERWIIGEGVEPVLIGSGFYRTNWQRTKILRRDKPALKVQRLTDRVFTWQRCPNDAVCAVVQPDGTAYWCVTADLEISDEWGGGWGLTKRAARGAEKLKVKTWTKIGSNFDATDWQHSMVLRPGFVTKVQDSGLPDSGKRESFSTGAVRDDAGDKPRPDLISPFFLERLGEHMRKGAIKYTANNWAKGIPNSRCWASLQRHLMKFAQGLHDEDHLAAAAFNLMAIIHNEEVAKRGIELKNPVTELVDIPLYGRKN